MKWSTLNHEQRVLLTAWMTLARCEGVSLRGELPVEYAEALAYLATPTKKRQRKRRRTTYRMVSDVPANVKRSPRARRAKHGLTT